MLVTCPECEVKISDESKECRMCGLPYAGRRSKEFCEQLAKNFSWPFIQPAFATFVIREHLESWRHGWCNLDYDGAAGAADEYIKIVHVFVCNYAHGSGYQVELALECRCGQKFTSHTNPWGSLLVEGHFRGSMCDACSRKA